MKHVSVFLLLLLMPMIASAHLAAGEDRVVNGTLIDFGYDPKVLVAGELASFSLNIVSEETELPLAVGDVWVRVSGQEGVLAASTQVLEQGNANWQFTFPTEGEYQIAVRAGEGESALDETFTVEVTDVEEEATPAVVVEEKTSGQIMSLVIGVILLIVVLIYFARRRPIV